MTFLPLSIILFMSTGDLSILWIISGFLLLFDSRLQKAAKI